MSDLVQQPLFSASDADCESNLEAAEVSAGSVPAQRDGSAPARHSRKNLGLILAALAMMAFVAAAVHTQGATAPVTSGKSTVISLDANQAFAANPRISYGLRKATCPDDASDKSEGATVTLDAIKEFVGAQTSDEVNFWWVYPKAKTDEDDKAKDWSAETQFQTFGGYMYTWGSQQVCLALTPQGEDLTMVSSTDFPEGEIDWHMPAGNGLKQFAWVPPTDDKTCEHGCFVYKSKDGVKSVFKVV